MIASVLPENATAAERGFERVAAERLASTAVPIDLLWDPARCPSAFLPWLAWALSVDDWDVVWSDDRKRAVIAASIEVHRHKGTLGGMKRALALAGFGDAIITEGGEPPPRLGRTHVLGRGWRMGRTEDTWADYWVAIMQPVAKREADRLASLLSSIAPARCRLRKITLSGARYVLGRDVWTLGRQITLGGVYLYEVA